MSDSFDGLDSSSNNSGAIHWGVPPRAGAVTVMLMEWLRNRLVRPKSAMRADLLLSIKMLLFKLIVSLHTETLRERNLRLSSLRARMAGREGISAHEQHLPTVEVGPNQFFPRIPSEILTSFDRLVSGHEVINCMIVPCSIHWETIIKLYEDLAAPTNGNRFGCLSCFHITTSRQKSYPAPVSTWQVSVL